MLRDSDLDTRADEYEPPALCLWCDDPMPNGEENRPYCSTLCGVYAELDSEDRAFLHEGETV